MYTVGAKTVSYSTGHRQRQNETRSNAFAAQLKRVCIHHAQVMVWGTVNAQSMEAKLLLTSQPVQGKRSFMIRPS